MLQVVSKPKKRRLNLKVLGKRAELSCSALRSQSSSTPISNRDNGNHQSTIMVGSVASEKNKLFLIRQSVDSIGGSVIVQEAVKEN